jgi:hypothetical protein
MQKLHGGQSAIGWQDAAMTFPHQKNAVYNELQSELFYSQAHSPQRFYDAEIVWRTISHWLIFLHAVLAS